MLSWTPSAICPRVTRLPLIATFLAQRLPVGIESSYGIWHCSLPKRRVKSGGIEMGPKVLLGLFVAAMATTSISVPAISQDAGLAGMHTWRREGGRTCMADHWHYG